MSPLRPPILTLLLCLGHSALQASGVLALNNNTQAPWSLVVPNETRDPAGSIDVEARGRIVATLRPGDRFPLRPGFRGLLVFQKDRERLNLRLRLEDGNRQFQEFQIYPDPNFNGQPHATPGANSALDVFVPASQFKKQLAEVMDYDLSQYSLSILADAFPVRTRSPSR